MGQCTAQRTVPKHCCAQNKLSPQLQHTPSHSYDDDWRTRASRRPSSYALPLLTPVLDTLFMQAQPQNQPKPVMMG